MRHGLLVLASLVLSACVTPAPVAVQPESLLHDAAFQVRPTPADPDVFRVSPAMRHFLEVEITGQLRAKGHLRGLVAALESHSRLKLEYDSVLTRTAAEAFEARAGNCLSLTILAAALARELGVPVSFRRVFSEATWTRRDDTLFRGGHVNIVLAPSPADRLGSLERVSGIVIDFLPQQDLQRQRSLEIHEQTVIAMFMNNRAAEAMALGLLDDAYWWARDATLRDAHFLEAFNTLGVIYSRHGDIAQAERVFRHVLAREAENTSALANLASVYDKQGRSEAALALRQKLQSIELHPPFHFFDLGLLALKRKDYAAAREHFARELARNASFHEAHFGLAGAFLGLGELEAARRQLVAALESSTSRREHDIYAAKLEWLRARRAQ